MEVDEFAELDNALAAIDEQFAPKKAATIRKYEIGSDAHLRELDERPAPPPPVPAHEDEFDALLDNPPPPIPEFDDQDDDGELAKLDLRQYVKPQERVANQGKEFETIRSLDIDAEAVIYAANVKPSAVVSPRQVVAPEMMRAKSASVKIPDTVKKVAPKMEAVPSKELDASPLRKTTVQLTSPREELRKSDTTGPLRKSNSTPVKSPRAMPGSGFRLPPIYEEFNLEKPPTEEEQKIVLPAIHPNAARVRVEVQMMDGRVEAIEACSDWVVQDLLHAVGAKLNLWQLCFFALSETNILSDAPDRWLDPRALLKDEGVITGSKLVFKIKYFKYPRKIRDPVAVHYFFAQTRWAVIRGAMETTESLAFKLGTLHLCLSQGNYRPQDHRVGFLGREMGKWIPGHWLSHLEDLSLDRSYCERRLFNAYSAIKDMSKLDACYAYLKNVSDLPLYGATLFNVSLNGEARVLAVAEDGILLSVTQTSKLQFFTPKGQIVSRPKYEFTPFEDIVRVELTETGVLLQILSDSDASTHNFVFSRVHALSFVELFSGYRRLLEAYNQTLSSNNFVYPVKPVHPHPALFSKPVARKKKLLFQNSRAEVFKSVYLRLCKEKKISPLFPLIRQLDLCIDTSAPFETFSLGNLRWGAGQIRFVLDALVSSKNHTFADDEDFSENMRLKWLDLSGNDLTEKGFFGELDRYFEELSKHPFELRGLAMRGCGLDDKAMNLLRPSISKLKMLERADFSKNPIREEGVKNIILAMRDANPSFLELTLVGCTLHEHKIMKLISAMLEKNARFARLNLSECQIADTGVAFLMKGLVNHGNIRSVDLSGNKLGSSRCSADLCLWISKSNVEEFRMARTEIPKKAAKIAASMFTQTVCSLRGVDLSDNDFGAKGSSVILEGLSQCDVLQEVHLGSFEISEKNVEFLLRFVKKCRPLTLLDLHKTPIGKNKTLEPILQALVDSRVSTLNLGGVQFLSSHGGEKLGDFLRSNSSLTKLILVQASFDKASFASFCRSLGETKSLVRIELDGCDLAKLSLEALRDGLRVSRVREVSLRACGLQHEQLLLLLQLLTLPTSSGLVFLDVRGNKEIFGDLREHKKFGKLYQDVLDPVYLELKCDTRKK